MDFNYHTHTYHCHHASGTPEEYVQRAVSGGIRFMGFSEHAPFMGADGRESLYRLPMSEIGVYADEVRGLAEKYGNDMEIRLGLEMEYYPGSFSQMLGTAVQAGMEYLILGQHFLEDESQAPESTAGETASAKRLRTYVSRVTEAVKSGCFTYIAHPDIFRFCGEPALYLEEMRRICVASREYGVPLEINFLGLRDGRHYPNEAFWQLAGEEKAPVTFGFDAHAAQDAFDGESLKKAEALAQKYHLQVIGRPPLRALPAAAARRL